MASHNPFLQGQGHSSSEFNIQQRYSTDTGIPFHLLKREKAPLPRQGTGASNLLKLYGLEEEYQQFCNKKTKESLVNFLPHLPGHVDTPRMSDDSLRMLIEKPPVGGRELLPLPPAALSSFRIMPGSVPEQFKFLNRPPEKKKKHKKHKIQEGVGIPTEGEPAEKKHKKKKRSEEPTEKKKKEKKKKKKKEKKQTDDAATVTSQ